MNPIYFIKFIEHSPEFYELIKTRSTAFVLFTILNDRARKADLKIKDDLSIGEAMTGANDCKLYKATRQTYRTDLKLLEKIGLILTIKVTSRGRIIKIINTSIFDIRRKLETNDSTNNYSPSEQQSATKQDDRSKSKEKNDFIDMNSRQSYKGESLKLRARKGVSAEEVR